MPILERDLSIPQIPPEVTQLANGVTDLLLLLERAVSSSLPTTKDFLDAGLAAYAVGWAIRGRKIPGIIGLTFMATLAAKKVHEAVSYARGSQRLGNIFPND